MSQREQIFGILSGKINDTVPAFSGLIHVTVAGLESEGLSLREVHHEARKMARAAASTFKLTGMPSATLPLDLCAAAEMLGAELNFEGEGFPQVGGAVIESARDVGELVIGKLGIGTLETGDWGNNRHSIICDAIRLVKENVGNDVLISGLIPGPYTLLLYICHPAKLFIEMKKEPQVVMDALFHLSSFLAKIGQAYRDAGADFITIHDMGGSPGFIGPARYEQFVFPSEKDLIQQLPKPCVLSVCGNVDKSVHLLGQTGTDAISVDQLTNLKAAREALKDVMLFGNLDPVATLWRGDEIDVAEAVHRAKEAGVDAVWPGCDLVPSTPIRNIVRMMSE